MSSSTVKWILHPSVFAGIVACYFLIYIPLLLWYLRRFLKSTNFVFVSKRHPIVTKLQIIAVIAFVGINISIIAFYHCIDPDSDLYVLLWDISIVTQPITLYASMCCLLWRCWHFYYDAQLNVHISSQWKTIIDPSFNSAPRNWFLDHASSFGSTAFIGKRLFVVYISACIVSMLVWWIDHIVGYTASILVDFVLLAMPYVLFFSLYRKTPKLVDELFISEEMHYVNYTLVAAIVCYLSIHITLAIVQQNEAMHALGALLSGFLGSTCWVVVGLLNTAWVMHKMRDRNYYSCEILSRTGQDLHSPASNSAEEMIQTNRVIEVLNTQLAFDTFVQYLNSEYSIECLLSFIEMMQFQQYVVQHKDVLNVLVRNVSDVVVLAEPDVDDEQQRDSIFAIKFQEFVPRSWIVEQHTTNIPNVALVNQMARELVDKYIAVDAPYEVNISYALRTKFETAMNESDVFDPQHVVLLLDQVLMEMLKLLEYSLARYDSALKDERSFNGRAEQ